MRIYHTPVIAAKTVQAFTDTSLDVNTSNADGSIIQQAIEKAIEKTIVTPLQNLCLGIWNKFMSVSYFMCLGIAMGGVVFYICGIQKGKKVAVIAVLTYLGLQILNWVILG